MQTKTKIGIAAIAIIILVVAVMSSNTKLFQGSFKKFDASEEPSAKKEEPIPVKKIDMPEPPVEKSIPVARVREELPSLIAFCSAEPSTIDPTRRERANISCTVNERLPDGLTIQIRDSAGATIVTPLNITTPVETGSYSAVWQGQYASPTFVPPGTYQYVVLSGTRNLNVGNIVVDYIPPTPPAPSYLTLIKNVVGGTSTVADFPLFINGSSVESGVRYSVPPGTYRATEISRLGYTALGWRGDCSPDGFVTLNTGDNKVCTIMNSMISVFTPGRLEVTEWNSPRSIIISAGSVNNVVASHSFRALYQDFQVRALDVQLSGVPRYVGGIPSFSSAPDTTPLRSIARVKLKYFNSSRIFETREASLDADGVARFSDLDIFVRASGSTSVETLVDLNTISAGARSEDNISLGISTISGYRFEAKSLSSGVIFTRIVPENQTRIPWHIVRKSQPIVARALSGLPSALTNGTNKLYGFTVRADGGDVSLKRIKFPLYARMNPDAQMKSFKFYRGTADLSPNVSIRTVSGVDAEAPVDIGVSTGTTSYNSLVVTFDDTPMREEIIPAGVTNTYYLEAQVSGALRGDRVSVNIPGDDLRMPLTAVMPEDLARLGDNFIWSDQGIADVTHSTATTDWINGFRVYSLPTDYLRLSY